MNAGDGVTKSILVGVVISARCHAPSGTRRHSPWSLRHRATPCPFVLLQVEDHGARQDEDEFGADGVPLPPGPARLVTEDGHDPPLLQLGCRLAAVPKVLVDRHQRGRLVGGEVEHRVRVEDEGGGTGHGFSLERTGPVR